MSRFVLPIVLEKDSDGYFAYCPPLQGCYTQGDTYEEALSNIEDAIRLHIEDRLARGEDVPTSDKISFTTLEVVAGPHEALHPNGEVPVQRTAWCNKREATFSDVLAQVRRQLWGNFTFQTST